MYALGHPKQRKVKLDRREFVFCVCCTVQLAVQHGGFLVQSALLRWLWELPAAKELRHYGTMAQWHYGAKV